MHIEGTDECSHQGNLKRKIRCAEYIDDRVARPLCEYLGAPQESRFGVLIDLRITERRCDLHPFGRSGSYVLYDSRYETAPDSRKQFHERAAAESGNYCEEGYTLADRFFWTKRIEDTHEKKTQIFYDPCFDHTSSDRRMAEPRLLPHLRPDITGSAAYVYCATTEEVLWKKNASKQYNLASITKLMTSLLAAEKLDSR